MAKYIRLNTSTNLSTNYAEKLREIIMDIRREGLNNDKCQYVEVMRSKKYACTTDYLVVTDALFVLLKKRLPTLCAGRVEKIIKIGGIF